MLPEQKRVARAPELRRCDWLKPFASTARACKYKNIENNLYSTVSCSIFSAGVTFCMYSNLFGLTEGQHHTHPMNESYMLDLVRFCEIKLSSTIERARCLCVFEHSLHGGRCSAATLKTLPLQIHAPQRVECSS